MTGRPGRFALMACLVLAACGGKTAPVASGPRIEIAIAPLHLQGTVEVGYHLVARSTGDGAVVWEADVTSALAADGTTSVSYSGPCVPGATYRIELTVEWLRGDQGLIDPRMYVDPTADGPLTLDVTCAADTTTVTFDVTIMAIHREFEVDIAFDDIFCSAKFDCVGPDGHALNLLFDPRTNERSSTVVLAFACTTGEGELTHLNMNDLYVACDDGTRYFIDPTGGNPVDGQMGPLYPLFFERASYRGREQLPDLDKCYWNVALGIDLGATSASCRLEASATASTGPLTADHDPRALTIYPYVHWSIDLTDRGTLACDRDPLGVVGSGTQVGYIELTDSPFQHSMECATTTITTPPRILCGGGVQPLDEAVSVTSTVGGVEVRVGGATSELYRLPEGLDVPDCCLSSCCADGE